jgi:Protein of unknown function (DUF3606)
MRIVKRLAARNKIDLADPQQIRAWTKRLKLSTSELQKIITKVGNSISAVTKEIELQRMAASGTLPEKKPSSQIEAVQ